jgi:hypothetical protein
MVRAEGSRPPGAVRVRLMRSQPLRAWCLVVAMMAALPVAEVRAQQSFATGQTIAPAYEGWERNDDGSFDLVFGYMNRNWEQVFAIPVGADNSIEPGGPDQGQPTFFHPRRNRFVFRIRVPADFGESELVWTLTSNGETGRAYGTLKPDYFIDDLVVQANYGAGGAAGTTSELPDNLPPDLTVVGAGSRTVRVGDEVTLTAVVTDDGKPRARPLPAFSPSLPGSITTDSATGLRFSWFVYRGPGQSAVFEPEQIAVWEDTRPGAHSPWAPGFETPDAPEDGHWMATATFQKPGTYVLRGIAHDGGLATMKDVTVVVH